MFFQAVSLYKELSRSGNNKATFYLAKILFDGEAEMEVDMVEAANLLEKIIESNKTDSKTKAKSLFYLSKVYRKQGHLQNIEKVVSLLKEAASLENPDAMFDLSNFYERGLGLARDLKQSVSLLEKASDLNHLDAKLELAKIYENGINGEISADLPKSIKLYEQLAEAGLQEAFIKLTKLKSN